MAKVLIRGKQVNSADEMQAEIAAAMAATGPVVEVQNRVINELTAMRQQLEDLTGEEAINVEVNLAALLMDVCRIVGLNAAESEHVLGAEAYAWIARKNFLRRSAVVDQIVLFLRSWLRLTRALETLLVDVVAATAPWLAPLVPAYMVWHSMVSQLGFDPYIAWAGATVVEFLGLSAVATTVQFFDWNDTKGERDSAAPVVVAIVAAVFYLAVVLTVNALLDPGLVLHKWAKGLLSSLSAVAAVILAIRGQHARRMTKREEDREDLRKRRAAARAETQNTQISQVSQDFSQDAAQDSPQDALPKVAIRAEVAPQFAPRPDWRRLSAAEQRTLVGVPWKEILQRYPGLSERAAQYWQERADELREVPNGNGHNHN